MVLWEISRSWQFIKSTIREDVRLCRMWLEKLLHSGPQERMLRNVYLEELCKHVQKETLGPPFNNPPGEGPLLVLPSHTLLPQSLLSTTGEETSSWSDATCDIGPRWSQNQLHLPREVVSSSSTGKETAGANSSNVSRRLLTRNPSRLRNSNHRRNRSPTSAESGDDTIPCKEVNKPPYISRTQEDVVCKLKNEISKLNEENYLLRNEVDTQKSCRKQLDQQLDTMKKELSQMRPIMQGYMNQLADLKQKQKSDNDALLNAEQWSKKYKELETKWKNIANSHKNAIKGYEDHINELKKELLTKLPMLENSLQEKIKYYDEKVYTITKNKDNEIGELKRQLHEERVKMKAEVGSMKQELERTSQENKMLLNAKLASFKSRIEKLEMANKETIQLYDSKLDMLNKAKDMELWVQKMGLQSEFSVLRQQDLENLANTLEEKYRKQLFYVMKRDSQNYDLESRFKEKITELEKEIMIDKQKLLAN